MTKFLVLAAALAVAVQCSSALPLRARLSTDMPSPAELEELSRSPLPIGGARVASHSSTAPRVDAFTGATADVGGNSTCPTNAFGPGCAWSGSTMTHRSKGWQVGSYDARSQYDVIVVDGKQGISYEGYLNRFRFMASRNGTMWLGAYHSHGSYPDYTGYSLIGEVEVLVPMVDCLKTSYPTCPYFEVVLPQSQWIGPLHRYHSYLGLRLPASSHTARVTFNPGTTAIRYLPANSTGFPVGTVWTPNTTVSRTYSLSAAVTEGGLYCPPAFPCLNGGGYGVNCDKCQCPEGRAGFDCWACTNDDECGGHDDDLVCDRFFYSKKLHKHMSCALLPGGELKNDVRAGFANMTIFLPDKSLDFTQYGSVWDAHISNWGPVVDLFACNFTTCTGTFTQGKKGKNSTLATYNCKAAHCLPGPKAPITIKLITAGIKSAQFACPNGGDCQLTTGNGLILNFDCTSGDCRARGFVPPVPAPKHNEMPLIIGLSAGGGVLLCCVLIAICRASRPTDDIVVVDSDGRHVSSASVDGDKSQQPLSIDSEAGFAPAARPRSGSDVLRSRHRSASEEWREALLEKDTVRSMEDVGDHPLDYAGDAASWRLDIDGLSFTLGSLPLLKPTSFSLLPGQMIAVMGASGAGKSTLLHCIVGRMARMGAGDGIVRGQMRLNGVAIAGSDSSRAAKAALADYRRSVAFVPQEFTLLPTLTVAETLLAAARLAGAPLKSCGDIVAGLLQELGLAHTAQTPVGDEGGGGGISGGERRRLRVALELVRYPRLLVLDEPTTGLDATSARLLIDVLRRRTREDGLIVLLTIHQPRASIFRQLDKLLLLASGGRQAFFGPPDEGVAAMRAACPPGVSADAPNPADVVLDVLNSSDIALDDVPPAADWDRIHFPSSPPPAETGFFRQLAILSWKTWLNVVRQRSLLVGHYGITAAVGLAMGGIYYNLGIGLPGIQNRVGIFFFTALYLSFVSISGIGLLFQDKKLAVADVYGRWSSVSALYLARLLCHELPLRVGPPLLYGGIMYYLCGLVPAPANFALFLLISVLISSVSSALVLFISTVTPSPSTATLVSVLVLIASMVFGGFLLNNTTVPVYLQWVRYASYFAYGFEALAINEFNGLRLEPRFRPFPAANLTGNAILANFNIDASAFNTDIYSLVALLGGYLFLALLGLRFCALRRAH